MLKTKNYFTSKTNVLKFLQPKLKKSKIEKIFDFTVVEWNNEKKLILSKIKKQFNQASFFMILRGSEHKKIIDDSDNKYKENEFMKLMAMKDYPRDLRSLALSDSRLIFCK